MNKKHLTAALALTMLTSSVSPTLSFAKTTDNPKVNWLVEQRWVLGRDGGDLALDSTIQRSEFVKMILAAQGLLGEAEAEKDNESKFKDVDKSHWANGVINLATEKGLVKGDDNGNFRPDDKISYNEILTILSRLNPSFKDDLSAGSNWADQYVKFAKNNGYLKDVKVDGEDYGTDATREKTFEIIYNYYHSVIPVFNKTTSGKDDNLTWPIWTVLGGSTSNYYNRRYYDKPIFPEINRDDDKNIDSNKPIESEGEKKPEKPGETEKPVKPTEPENSEETEDPVKPSEPEKSTETEDPEKPTEPEKDTETEEPTKPTEPEKSEEPEKPVYSEDEIYTLEELQKLLTDKNTLSKDTISFKVKDDTISENELYYLLRNVLHESAFLSRNYEISPTEQIQKIDDDLFHVKARIFSRLTKEEMDYVESFVKEWVSQNIDSSMSDKEKLDKIYDYLKGYKENNEVKNIAEAISLKQAYTSDINAIFELLAIESGLDIKYLGERASWHMVEVDGNWYHLYMDGAVFSDKNQFYLVSDKDMKNYSRDSKWDDSYPRVPKSYRELNYGNEEYRVKFIIDSEKSINGGIYSGNYKAGSSINEYYIPKIKSKYGYRFIGWSPEIPSNITKNMTIEAQFEELDTEIPRVQVIDYNKGNEVNDNNKIYTLYKGEYYLIDQYVNTPADKKPTFDLNPSDSGDIQKQSDGSISFTPSTTGTWDLIVTINGVTEVYNINVIEK